MKKFKSYDSFFESISDIFRSAHSAIEKKDLQPLEKFLGKPKFPTKEEFQEVVDFLGADPSYFFYDKTNFLHPIVYWKGPMYYGFFGGLNMEALKMLQADKYFKHSMERFQQLISQKKFESLFSMMDKKVLIPNFIEMYKEIPDNKKYDIFTDLYTRSEYGFQMFPIEIIKDCFDKRHLSEEWKERMMKFKEDARVKDGKVTVYRGENSRSEKSDDAFSWTLDKKTAKFFADRFSKGSGKISSKEILLDEVIDYLDNRGESEVILFPKKFGSLKESALTEELSDVITITSPAMYPIRIVITNKKITVKFWIALGHNHPRLNTIIWFEIHKEGEIVISKTDDPIQLKYATEEQITIKFHEIFDTWTSVFLVGPTQKTGSEAVQYLLENPMFEKWWKRVNETYRGAVKGKKYGI